MNDLLCTARSKSKAIGAFLGTMASLAVAHYGLKVPDLYLLAIAPVAAGVIVHRLRNVPCP